MDLQVLFQVATRCKLLVANAAFKRLLASVDPLVADQVGNLGESLSATRVFALVRLLLVVHSRVLLER